jgi:predicted dehydrogenase
MNLTPEQKELGRRNFLKALAGTPALAALAATATMKGPKSGGPVKAAIIGSGREGKVLLGQCDRNWIDLRAVCDINPVHGKTAAEALAKAGHGNPTVYQDYKEMLQKENLEAIIIATPLFTHSDVTVDCLNAGKHVLCEKMMAWDVPSAQRMLDASRKNKRILEIGHQRFYNATYQMAYEGFVKKELLGDIHYIRTLWHRNGNWRWEEKPPENFDPKQWGYPDWEHYSNWRLFKKYSRGLMAELASHQIAICNWFYGDAVPEAAYASGGTYVFKSDREIPDHVFATFEYSGGRTATFTSVQTNAYDDNYEQIMGTKGTLILKGEVEHYFFPEAEAAKLTTVETTKRTGDAIHDASESRTADASGGRTVEAATTDPAALKQQRLDGYRNEINGFCAAIRTGAPLLCTPERALGSAAACIRAYEACDQKARLTLA